MAIVLALAALSVILKWLEPEPIPLRIETGPVRSIPTPNNPFPFEGKARTTNLPPSPPVPDTARYTWELCDALSCVATKRYRPLLRLYSTSGYGRDVKVIARVSDLRADSLFLHIHCSGPPPMPQWEMRENPALEDKSYESA